MSSSSTLNYLFILLLCCLLLLLFFHNIQNFRRRNIGLQWVGDKRRGIIFQQSCEVPLCWIVCSCIWNIRWKSENMSLERIRFNCFVWAMGQLGSIFQPLGHQGGCFLCHGCLFGVVDEEDNTQTQRITQWLIKYFKFFVYYFSNFSCKHITQHKFKAVDYC